MLALPIISIVASPTDGQKFDIVITIVLIINIMVSTYFTVLLRIIGYNVDRFIRTFENLVIIYCEPVTGGQEI